MRYRLSGAWCAAALAAQVASSGCERAVDGAQSPEWPNQPQGFTKITSRAFDATAEDGWIALPGITFSIQVDSSAPKTPPHVGQALFPLGLVGGSGPISTARDLGSQYRAIYISCWIKLSANWVGHSSNVNKIFHLWSNGSNRVYVQAYGAGSSRLQPAISTQSMNEPNRDLFSNLQARPFSRGVWHRWEIVLRANTNGQPNGEVRWWFDGVESGRYTDLNFVGATDKNVWESLDWNPTWGGVGDLLLADQTMQIDHLYISGGS
jgi:hypothetical protein